MLTRVSSLESNNHVPPGGRTANCELRICLAGDRGRRAGPASCFLLQRWDHEKEERTMKLIGLILLPLLAASSQTAADFDLRQYSQQCDIWPRNFPPEHRNDSCDRSLQNSQLTSKLHKKGGTIVDNPLPLAYYMELPQEKTWACPLEDNDAAYLEGGSNRFGTAQATNWILYNEASTPVIVERVHESPLVDVGGGTEERKTAVYPHGE